MKKIKLSTETKIALVAFVIVTIICAIAVAINFGVYGAAYADGEEVEPVVEEATDVQPAPEPTEKDDLVTVFKNNILPYLASAGVSLVGFFAMLLPYIKVRGQNKALQGMYAVMTKTVEAYKAKEGELTVDNISKAINENFFEALKVMISAGITEAVKANVKDTTGDFNELKAEVDVLSAQITTLLKAASLTWGEVDGVKELLAKSPTASVLVEYLAKFKEIKAQIEAQNADATKEVDATIAELEGISNEEQ